MQYEIRFFKKTECLVKTVKKYFKKKVEYLASTYKGGGLSYKLPKRTLYIREFCILIISFNASYEHNIFTKISK